MDGLRIAETEKIAEYGYRIHNQKEDVSVYYEDTKVLEISSFNQEAKLRLCFTQKDITFLVNWVSIKPKKKEKGLLVGYNKDGKLFGKEIINNLEPSN